LADAQALLGRAGGALKTIDKAVSLPKCWFDRNWSQGAALLFPELNEMRQAVRYVSLRGAVAAEKGDVGGALANVDEICAIARHQGQEPDGISREGQFAIYCIGVSDLERWAFIHRDRSEYREALAKAIESMPKPCPRVERRDDLFMVLSLAELSATREGRAKLGVSEKDVKEIEKQVPAAAMSPMKAKVGIVKAEREYWAALGRSQKEWPELLSKATWDLNDSLAAFPIADALYFEDYDDPTIMHEQAYKARKLADTAALRALAGPTIPSSIKTSDLLSPYDGKPLQYSYDGKHVVISVSRPKNDSGPMRVKFPPDAALKP